MMLFMKRYFFISGDWSGVNEPHSENHSIGAGDLIVVLVMLSQGIAA